MRTNNLNDWDFDYQFFFFSYSFHHKNVVNLFDIFLNGSTLKYDNET